MKLRKSPVIKSWERILSRVDIVFRDLKKAGSSSVWHLVLFGKTKMGSRLQYCCLVENCKCLWRGPLSKSPRDKKRRKLAVSVAKTQFLWLDPGLSPLSLQYKAEEDEEQRLQWPARLCGCSIHLPPVRVDRRCFGGDKIKLGGTDVICAAAPAAWATGFVTWHKGVRGTAWVLQPTAFIPFLPSTWHPCGDEHIGKEEVLVVLYFIQQSFQMKPTVT